ncbi:O-antigen ligase family protein [Winogradskyella haliclonae]|uniref:Uncharacterized protein n=1 Tax=Winogradskyella haliclonae TaxID=2048558 RepID=A0ABQ2BX31_9FLAO|nr:O-antigen ligase family protein [Winogradskyella haliclonae]GGI56293.1 hypothetical protein GCM10011444_06020 [Winogradskyella haliclonae]
MKSGDFKITKVIGVLVILLFALEAFVTVYTQLIDYNKVRILGIYKVTFQVIILFLIKYKNLNKKILYLLIGFIFVFCISTLLNPLLNHNFIWLLTKGSIYFFDRYILIILFALMLLSRKNQVDIVKTSFRYIEIILLVNSAIILFAFLFNLDFFKSYINSNRFGYDGLFNKPNEISIVYIIYIVYLYYKSFVDKTKTPILFITISIISLLLGTKSILLFFSLLFIFHFLFIFNGNKFVKRTALGLVIVVLFFFNTIIKYFFGLFSFWSNIEDINVLTLLLSNRDVLVCQNIKYLNSNWSTFNYIVGGGFYTNDFVISQMDGIDLFIFFGIAGMLIYCLMLGQIFIKKNKITSGLIIIVFTCSFLGGGLLTSAISMILLLFVSTLLNSKRSDV